MLPRFWTSTAKIIIIIVVILAASASTDADLIDKESVSNNSITASTLDFSTRDTANNTTKSLFFNIQGMQRGGFQVNSIRISNDGALPVTFLITAQQTSGDAVLCEELELTVLSNWKELEHGVLTEFEYQSDLETESSQDFVFSLNLPSTSTIQQQKNCTFTIKVQSLQENLPGSVRFFDEEILDNQVSSGG